MTKQDKNNYLYVCSLIEYIARQTINCAEQGKEVDEFIRFSIVYS